jgi:hypothetical protein
MNKISSISYKINFYWMLQLWIFLILVVSFACAVDQSKTLSLEVEFFLRDSQEHSSTTHLQAVISNNACFQEFVKVKAFGTDLNGAVVMTTDC